MRPLGVIIAVLLVSFSLHLGCVAAVPADGDSAVAGDAIDTLPEAFELYFQWVNPTNVKVEFDMVIDNSAPIHFELSRGNSLAILVGLNQEQDREPITVAADNVSVVRVNTNCPDDVVFENISFGDVFAGTMIPFAQGAAADETTLSVESGVVQPATFVCYSAWQIIVEDSSIVVTAFDREPIGTGESEVEVGASIDTNPAPPTTDPVETDNTRPLPVDIAPRIIDGPPSIGPG